MNDMEPCALCGCNKPRHLMLVVCKPCFNRVISAIRVISNSSSLPAPALFAKWSKQDDDG